MRRKKKRSPLTALVVILCLALLGGAGYLLWRALPQKKAPDTVSSLETGAVFENDNRSAVQPEREQDYDGERPAPQTQQEPAQEEPVPDEQPAEQPGSEASPEQTLAKQTLAAMSLDEKIWQLFFVTPESLTGYPKVTEAGLATKEALGYKPVGGLIYFAQNLEDREQVTAMLTTVQTFTKIPLFLGTDEEGGTVSRVGSNAALGGQNIGDMAVADVSGGRTDNVIGSRSFGTEPELCASMVSVALGALQDSGVTACLKHFPGYGSAVTDDHYGTSVLNKTAEELEGCDLLPFASGIESGAAFVMVSHLSVPAVTGDETPADLSEKIISELLRNKLGFENVIITDAQNMASITDHYTPAEAAVGALKAGADMIRPT